MEGSLPQQKKARHDREGKAEVACDVFMRAERVRRSIGGREENAVVRVEHGPNPARHARAHPVANDAGAPPQCLRVAQDRVLDNVL